MGKNIKFRSIIKRPPQSDPSRTITIALQKYTEGRSRRFRETIVTRTSLTIQTNLHNGFLASRLCLLVRSSQLSVHYIHHNRHHTTTGWTAWWCGCHHNHTSPQVGQGGVGPPQHGGMVASVVLLQLVEELLADLVLTPPQDVERLVGMQRLGPR